MTKNEWNVICSEGQYWVLSFLIFQTGKNLNLSKNDKMDCGYLIESLNSSSILFVSSVSPAQRITPNIESVRRKLLKDESIWVGDEG